MVKIPACKILPPQTFNPTWKTLFVLMIVFLFFQSLFYFKLFKNNQPQTSLSAFKYWWKQRLNMKKIEIFLQLFYFGLFKTNVRLVKCVKPIRKLFFSKCLVVLGKASTWEKREGKFHCWQLFYHPFHFDIYKGLS